MDCSAASSAPAICGTYGATPALATAVVFRESASSWAAFEQKAAYLWDANQQGEWFNVGRRTFECTKVAISLKIAAIWRTHGVEIFAENLRRVHANASLFETMLRADSRFEIAVSPESNIVCFRLKGCSMSESDEDALQVAVRREMISSGEWYIVQTTLAGRVWLRTALMNPFTKESDLQGLLEKVAAYGAREVGPAVSLASRGL
jgi:L-2,4-diaminobutyrate decarboxylase